MLKLLSTFKHLLWKKCWDVFRKLFCTDKKGNQSMLSGNKDLLLAGRSLSQKRSFICWLYLIIIKTRAISETTLLVINTNKCHLNRSTSNLNISLPRWNSWYRFRNASLNKYKVKANANCREVFIWASSYRHIRR